MEKDKMEKEKKEQGKKGGRSLIRTGIGVAIMLVGIGVCLYPFYRQKKSDDFNQEAINRILTPQPEDTTTPDKGQEGLSSAGTQESDVQAANDLNAAEPGNLLSTETETIGTSLSLLGEDLLENPDAPDVQEEDSTEDEKENANRLNGKTVIGVIQIPKIELIYAIVEGSDAAEIGVAIGHMSGTAKLGEIGNCALAGHRGGYSGPYFKNLDQLEIGDEVIITNTNHEVFTYKVTETMVVEPDEVWVVEDTGEGVAMLTLVTCENSGAQRLIVRCVVK